MKDKLRRGKREDLIDARPPRKAIRQVEDLDNLTKGKIIVKNFNLLRKNSVYFQSLKLLGFITLYVLKAD